MRLLFVGVVSLLLTMYGLAQVFGRLGWDES